MAWGGKLVVTVAVTRICRGVYVPSGCVKGTPITWTPPNDVCTGGHGPLEIKVLRI